jgi:hypothetical protein
MKVFNNNMIITNQELSDNNKNNGGIKILTDYYHRIVENKERQNQELSNYDDSWDAYSDWDDSSNSGR